jgi:hypothetical protein
MKRNFHKISLFLLSTETFFFASSSWKCLPDVSHVSHDLGTRWTRTGDSGFIGLLSYPLDHEVLVVRVILELPDILCG